MDERGRRRGRSRSARLQSNQSRPFPRMITGRTPRMTKNGAGTVVEAPQRAERIAAFRAELAELAREGVLVLTEEERARVDAHQDAVLKTVVQERTPARELSLGLRAGALVGSGALAVSAIL